MHPEYRVEIVGRHRAAALVEAYRKTLKPSDVLADDPGPFMLAI
jgi:hypothetical protein